MGTFTVYSPNRTFTGTTAGVAFSGGKAAAVDDETSAAALGYFRRKGYAVLEGDNATLGAEAEAELAARGRVILEPPTRLAGPGLVDPNRGPMTLDPPDPDVRQAGPELVDPSAGFAGFNPSDNDVAAVLEYLGKVPDRAEAERVLDAEAAGKGRKGIVDTRDATLARFTG